MGAGPALVPWRKPTEKQVLDAVKRGADYLPLMYQEKYAEPLMRNLGSVIARSSASRYSGEDPEQTEQTHKRNMEILAGAVYCHVSKGSITQKVVTALHCFLAVISNTYRSFLPTKPKYGSRIPTPPAGFYPPLATFRSGNAEVPCMLTRDVIERISGGSVGIVVMPTIYKDHPLLWTAIAHEVGGHEMMNATPGLLQELEKGVGQLFNVRNLSSDYTEGDLDEEQLTGLLWRYWTEETVSDVCGVLNLGPAYGISLAVYQAALNRAFAEKFGAEPATPHRLWAGEKPELAQLLDPDSKLPELDSHPVDVLKLHVIIGAVENLKWLPTDTKRDYIQLLEKLAHICAGSETEIHICGLVQSGPDLWIKVNTAITRPLKLAQMQSAARRVGAYLASVELGALNGDSLQGLETWDHIDEERAQAIARAMKEKKDISALGDDAQLLAGATLAFSSNPDEYEHQTAALKEALEDSYARDYYWGLSRLHFLVEYPPPDVMEELAQEVAELASQRVGRSIHQGKASKATSTAKSKLPPEVVRKTVQSRRRIREFLKGQIDDANDEQLVALGNRRKRRNRRTSHAPQNG